MKSRILKIVPICILLFTLFIPSCIEPEPELDCGCENGGSCINNICNCPPGYEGVYCETYTGTATDNCAIAQQYLSENQIRAALQSFVYDGSPTASISEARAMLKHLCSSVNLHAGDNTYVCAKFSDGKHITIWVDPYGKAGTYGFRYNNTDNHTHFGNNATYFEIKKSTNSGYNCVNGNCQPVTSGAQFTSLSACQTACSTPPPQGGYNCVNGNCQYVASGAQYTSLSACQSACGNTGNPTNKMVVAIAIERKYCGTNYYYTNPIYSYYHGTASNAALTESAKNAINQNYSGHESITFYYSEGKGNYVIIISTTDSESPSCPRQTFAVGFGQNRTEALVKAQESLYGLNWYWNYGDPFKVELDTTF